MSKPSWGQAPVWARWLAQDRNGNWHWYENRPECLFPDWFSRGGKREFAGESRCWLVLEAGTKVLGMESESFARCTTELHRLIEDGHDFEWANTTVPSLRFAIEALEAIDALARERDKLLLQVTGLRDVVRRTSDRADEAEADAGRYRWLRTSPNNLRQEVYCGSSLLRMEEYLDMAIDDLMEREKRS